MSPLRAGQLRSWVELQTRTSTQDTEGSPTDTWRSVDRVPARVRPLSAREYLLAAQAGETITHLVTIRYRDDVTHNARLLLDGNRALNILTATDPEELQEQLDLYCEEIKTGS
jgi:SPP1 family predicted phage head-tail adaptor